MLEDIFRHPPQDIIPVSDHIFIHGPHTSPAFFFRVVVAFRHGWVVIAQGCWSDIRFPVARYLMWAVHHSGLFSMTEFL